MSVCFIRSSSSKIHLSLRLFYPHSYGLVSCWPAGSSKRRLLASCLQLLALRPVVVSPSSLATSSKSSVLTKLCALHMLPSSACMSSPSKSSSSSAIGWCRFHCFILPLCSWWFLTWWPASRNLSWWRSCSSLIHEFTNLQVTMWQKDLCSYAKVLQVGGICTRHFAFMFLTPGLRIVHWRNCSIFMDNPSATQWFNFFRTMALM